MDMARSSQSRHDITMDDATLALCLQHLEAADRLMVNDADGWHRARLSHVIEGLKETYGPRPWPLAAAFLTVQ